MGRLFQVKKHKIFTAVLAVLLLFLALLAFRRWYWQPSQIYERNKELLNATIAEYEASGSLTFPTIPGVHSVNEWGTESPIVEFCTEGFGIAPASVYRGFYYSPSGKPASFQNGTEALRPTKDGWEWSGPGDNGGTTRNLEGNWFLFEAHF